jgi:hypothetical protein
MIEKLSPTLEMALQNELREAYLKGVETGRKLEREAMKETIIAANDIIGDNDKAT